MQRECFQSKDIAKVLNENCVSIKVDREERPDVDDYYIRATEPFGTGGWPLSVFLSPDLHIITAATYMPPHSRMGMKSFPEVCQLVHRLWKNEPEKITNQGNQLQELISEHMKSISRGELADASAISGSLEDVADSAGANLFHSLYQRFDAKAGGYGDAPKFPRPVEPIAMTNIAAREYKTENKALAPSPFSEILEYKNGASLGQFMYHGNLRMELEQALKKNGFSLPNESFDIKNFSKGEKALGSVWFTMRRMLAGGIHDHLAGGFHRYAVDSRWIVPHFEKMLYDQSGITLAMLDAYLTTGDISLGQAARATLDFVHREMTNSEGGVFAALDADSGVPPELDANGKLCQHSAGQHKREGAFYVWKSSEIDQVLDFALRGKKTGSLKSIDDFDRSLPAGVDVESAKSAFKVHYTIRTEGNASERSLNPHGELDEQNVIIPQGSLDSTLVMLQAQNGEVWGSMTLSESRNALASTLATCREALRRFRSEVRPYPHVDEKVVTAWNGMMMAAFARGAQVLPSEVMREGIYCRLHDTAAEDGKANRQHFAVYTPASEYLAPEQAERIRQAGERIVEAVDTEDDPLNSVRKVVTEVNGEHSKYVESAKNIAEFVHKYLTISVSSSENVPGVRLLRSFCGNASRVAAFAEDYAALIYGLIELYEACGDTTYLKRAVELQQVQNALFWDDEHGAYFSTSKEGQSGREGDAYTQEHFAPVRSKPFHDGAEPSANSLSALNLVSLSALVGDKDFEGKGRKILNLFKDTMQSKSIIMPLLYTAYDIAREAGVDDISNGMADCVVAGQFQNASTRAMMYSLYSKYDKCRVVSYADGGRSQEYLREKKEIFHQLTPPENSEDAKVYICKNRTCSKPSSDPFSISQ